MEVCEYGISKTGDWLKREKHHQATNTKERTTLANVENHWPKIAERPGSSNLCSSIGTQ